MTRTVRTTRPGAELLELEALIRAQAQDLAAQARGRVERRPRASTAVLDEERTAGVVAMTGNRMHGEELVEHVRWRARRDLEQAAGRKLTDEDLVALARLAGVDPARRAELESRRRQDREAAVHFNELAGAFERARRFLRTVGPERGRVVWRLARLVGALEAAAELDPLVRLRRGLGAANVLRRYLRPFDPPPPVLGLYGRVAVLVEPRTELGRHHRAVAALLGLPKLSDRLLAAASLVAGNWPEGLGLDEADAVPAEEVERAEREAVRQARHRHG